MFARDIYRIVLITATATSWSCGGNNYVVYGISVALTTQTMNIQHGGNVLHSLKMQVVSCFEKNHFMFDFGGKCRTLNVLIL